MEGFYLWILRYLLQCFILCLFILLPSTHAQPGFLSIACCADSNYTDNNLQWIPDDGWFPDRRGCRTIRRTNGYKKARVFDLESSPMCYTLTTIRDREYLVRGSFSGNTETAGPGSSFQVVVGKTVVGEVDSTVDSVVEGIFRATDEAVDFCLVQENGDVYISSLELRRVDGLGLAEGDPSRILKVVDRIDLGGSSAEIRYPEDRYDRVWKPASSPESEASANVSVHNATTTVPLEVLHTAVTKPTRLDFSHSNLDTGYFNYSIILYFLELNETVSVGKRVFDIYINKEKRVEKFDILADGSNYKEVTLSVRANRSLNFSLVKVPNGFDLGPICNGYEIFQVQPWVQPVDPGDVTMMGEGKQRLLKSDQVDNWAVMRWVRYELWTFNQEIKILTENWTGNPCPNRWEGVVCDNSNDTTFKITALDLSSKGFYGPIPSNITNLTDLEYLNLSCNYFNGTIPTFLLNSSLKSVFVGCNPLLNTSFPTESPNLVIDDNNTMCQCKSEKQGHGFAIGMATSGFIVFIVLLGTVFCCRRKKLIAQGIFDEKQHPMKSNPVYNISSMDDVIIKPISKQIETFTLEYIETVTQKYKTVIGEGGFGLVYQGTLLGGEDVAVKVLSATSTQGTREFDNELNLLSAIRHENLVPLLGYCRENDQQILVYPFMSNGSLQDRLYGEAAKRKILDWPTRLSIALGAGRGLMYLHTFARGCVIHRDVKSSNILLDHSMCAKVADFGFSKYAPQEGDTGVSLEVRGTAGYLDPEYYSTQQLSAKSDVYSFGVVLLEIVSGREPLNIKGPRKEWSLVEWAKHFIRESRIEEIVDRNIKGLYHAEAMWRVVEVALTCTEPLSANRPCMDDIVRELEDALIIENNASEYMKSIDSLYSIGGSNRIPTAVVSKLLPSIPNPMDPSPVVPQAIAPPEPR
ncbi:hypothetical protein SLE2022_300060 [Rubroshorea leprosula]